MTEAEVYERLGRMIGETVATVKAFSGDEPGYAIRRITFRDGTAADLIISTHPEVTTVADKAIAEHFRIAEVTIHAESGTEH